MLCLFSMFKLKNCLQLQYCQSCMKRKVQTFALKIQCLVLACRNVMAEANLGQRVISSPMPILLMFIFDAFAQNQMKIFQLWLNINPISKP